MEYNYTREIQGDGRYNIGYSGEITKLANEIQTALPTLTSIKVRCNGGNVVVDVEPTLSTGDKGILDTVVSDHKSNIQPLPSPYKLTGDFNDPINLDFNLFGLHKDRVFDIYGSLIEVNYYTDYDGSTYSGLAVKDEFNYTILSNDLVLHRVETITWYKENGDAGIIKTMPTKWYIKGTDYNDAIREGQARRTNLVTKTKAYGMGAITGDQPVVSGEPVMSNALHFMKQMDDANLITSYIDGIKDPLIDFIQDSTETYLTQTIKDTMTGILKYW
jgi:hypothetical protein